jgi:hypothetical protein
MLSSKAIKINLVGFFGTFLGAGRDVGVVACVVCSVLVQGNMGIP